MGRKAAIKRERRQARSAPGRAWPMCGGAASKTSSPRLPDLEPSTAELARALEADGHVVRRTPPPGMRKMSDVFTEFAAPAIAVLHENEPVVTVDAMEAMLKLAFMVWNAVEMGPGGEPILDEVRDAVRTDAHIGEVMSDVVETLVERKRTQFADDHRLLASFQVTEKSEPGDFNIAVAYGYVGWDEGVR